MIYNPDARILVIQMNQLSKNFVVNHCEGDVMVYNQDQILTDSVYSIHHCKDGNSMMICQMSDGHLENTCLLIIKQLFDLHPLKFQQIELDPLTATMTKGKAAQSAEANRDKFLKKLKQLEPYVLELTIRGQSNKLTKSLQLLLNRKQSVYYPQLIEAEEEFNGLLNQYENVKQSKLKELIADEHQAIEPD